MEEKHRALEVERHCRAFRKAILSIPCQNRPVDLAEFPRASCGSTSEMIGTYLESLGFGQFEYVHGSKPGICSHAWIRQGCLIIDLTADQFDGICQDVIVSDDSWWHNEFEIESAHKIDMGAADRTALMPLTPFYMEVFMALHGVKSISLSSNVSAAS